MFMARFLRHRAPGRRVVPGIVAGAAVLAAAIVGAQGNNTFTLFIVASDASGKPVTDLKPEEVAFAESGMPGKVATLERFNLPARVTIVIDNGPDSERALEHVRNGLNGFIDALPADVETTLITAAPQPRTAIKATVNKDELKKGFGRVARDSDSGRFSDSIVEYSQRLDKELRDKKVLTYLPVLVVIGTIGGDASSYQLNDIQRHIETMAKNGARGFVVTTTSRVVDNEVLRDLKEGRQGTIGRLVAGVTRGAFEAVSEAKNLPPVLAAWGKRIGEAHTKQTSQYRLVLERPASLAAQPLDGKNIDLRVTRPGLTGAVSVNGLF
jgi:hypothetical protein